MRIGNRKVPLLSFKIEFRRIRRCLRKVDPSKASNGVGNPFLNECADEIADAVDSLFKFIVRKSSYPSDWKEGAVTAAHKRGSVKLSKNYRPIQVVNNLSSVFEGTVMLVHNCQNGLQSSPQTASSDSLKNVALLITALLYHSESRIAWNGEEKA